MKVHHPQPIRRNKIQALPDCVISRAKTMATPRVEEALPPARPSTSQASRTLSQMNRSVARCVLQGQNLMCAELHEAESQDTPAHTSVDCLYSAESPDACVSTTATNTARQTPVYGRSMASHRHYLERTIRLITSLVDSFNQDLASEVKLLNSKLSSYADDLDKKIQLMNGNKDVHVAVVKEFQLLKKKRYAISDNFYMKMERLKKSHSGMFREIEILKARKISHDHHFTTLVKKWQADKSLDAHELDRRIKNTTARKEYHDQCVNEEIQELNAKIDAQYKDMKCKRRIASEDIDKQIQIVKAKKGASAHGLIMEMKATKDSYSHHQLDRANNLFYARTVSFSQEINRQYGLLNSKKAPFAGELDRHLKLLDSKITSFNHDVREQQDLMDSKVDSYVSEMGKKMDLLNKDITSCLWG